jgi:hypothetical protein
VGQLAEHEQLGVQLGLAPISELTENPHRAKIMLGHRRPRPEDRRCPIRGGSHVVQARESSVGERLVGIQHSDRERRSLVEHDAERPEGE